MGSKNVKKCAMPRLIISLLFILIVVVVALLYFVYLSPSHAPRIKTVGVTGIVSVFNNVGYKFFSQHGYMIAANYTPTKFPTAGIEVFSGFQTTALVGTLSLSSDVYALIFNNSAMPAEEASNQSMAYEYFGYEIQNPSIRQTNNQSIDGIIVRFYNITTSLLQSANATIYLNNSGSVFAFHNVLVFGIFKNQTQAVNVNQYLVDQVVQSYG